MSVPSRAPAAAAIIVDRCRRPRRAHSPLARAASGAHRRRHLDRQRHPRLPRPRRHPPGDPDAARRVRRLEPRPASATGPGRSSAGSGSAAPSRTPPTTPSPTSSGAGRARRRSITQNVDGLHQAAGSRDVTELHGSLAEVRLPHLRRPAPTATCSRPGWPRPTRASSTWPAARRPTGRGSAARSAPTATSCSTTPLTAGFHLPRCTVCGADTLKPDVVFFGDSVPKDTVDACFAIIDDATRPARPRLLARRDDRDCGSCDTRPSAASRSPSSPRAPPVATT